MATELLSIHNLAVYRGNRQVLEVCELTVHKKEILAIVGPNGAGKSTLLLAIARLLRPRSGEIRFNGQSTKSETDLTYRRRLALVLQDPLLFDLSVYDNIASGLSFRGWPKQKIQTRVETWLDRLGISHLAYRSANELSGGEGQRVSLARALALEPELLLLDEPFGALDPPTRSRLFDDLGKILPESNTTTIFITHNLAEARKLAGRMAVIHSGCLQACGAPDEILRSFPSLNGE